MADNSGDMSVGRDVARRVSTGRVQAAKNNDKTNACMI
jgi:hypothetical protein